MRMIDPVCLFICIQHCIACITMRYYPIEWKKRMKKIAWPSAN